jgi:hypothetical protein
VCVSCALDVLQACMFVLQEAAQRPVQSHKNHEDNIIHQVLNCLKFEYSTELHLVFVPQEVALWAVLQRHCG